MRGLCDTIKHISGDYIAFDKVIWPDSIEQCMLADCVPWDVIFFNKFRKMQACFRQPGGRLNKIDGLTRRWTHLG